MDDAAIIVRAERFTTRGRSSLRAEVDGRDDRPYTSPERPLLTALPASIDETLARLLSASYLADCSLATVCSLRCAWGDRFSSKARPVLAGGHCG
jgi:hypothetical protein